MFPACSPCNQASSDDEALFALICRLYPKQSNEEQSEATRKLMQAVSEKLPHIFQSFLPSSTKIKSWFREAGYTLPAGQTTKDIPIISLEHPEINKRVKNCATKLFLSLHYFHTKEILPSEGGIFFIWYSNATNSDRIPTEIIAPFITEYPKLKWQKIDLSDQFMYQYGADPKGLVSIFHVTFHASIGMLGIVFSNCVNITAEVPEAQILRPFNRHTL